MYDVGEYPEQEIRRTLEPLCVGFAVRRTFLTGVAAICHEHSVDWEWELRWSVVGRRVVITLHGPPSGIDEAAAAVSQLARRFPMDSAG